MHCTDSSIDVNLLRALRLLLKNREIFQEVWGHQQYIAGKIKSRRHSSAHQRNKRGERREEHATLRRAVRRVRDLWGGMCRSLCRGCTGGCPRAELRRRRCAV